MAQHTHTVEGPMQRRENKWELFVSAVPGIQTNIGCVIKELLYTLATAESVQDQCELPGCTKPKRKERDRVHEYCCLDHSKQDEPNREGI